ncbi:MAG: C4-dicarboxylate ABC transporter permease [Desulfovibrio sp. S3730MH75]|nr:MAG: C4-dicarboxylate ABC transporter permease [Desulfovibrio sp. S3730MH75]
MQKLENFIRRTVDYVGLALASVLILMVLNVSFDVMMRYMFHASSVGMQEMEWHLFAIIILFGMGVGLQHDAHVRVDFVYDRLGPKKRAMINIWGTIIMLVPLSLLILFGSFEYVQDAFISNEISEDPGGLPYRWIVKSMIPTSFVFLLYSAVGFVLTNIRKYKEAKL